MGISIWQLLIILAIVLLLFGAKRLRSVGSDLGAAIKGFKQSVKDEEAKAEAEKQTQLEKKEANGQVFDSTATPSQPDDKPKA
ncbi:MAG TPA: twin-arginine translocase TatA/TatE family subunit [Piscirickettsiaceae bacterium]|nr:twin-arginine translocase TatA/TatE family subunit [Piscirickettsiaceae bacterium]HIQ39815.1 twin-arginine translocase TatA/TatE family subunit [Sulfurivirga caldicuralii]